MKRVYASKIDWWLLAILVAVIFVVILACWRIVVRSGLSQWLVLVPIIIMGVGLPLWLLLTTRYILETDTLRVQSGPFRWKVFLREITGITLTRNPLSSPALSLDRLRIDYGSGRSIMISPREKEAFIRELEAKRAGSPNNLQP